MTAERPIPRQQWQFGRAYKWYVLAAMTTLYTLNYVDRGLISLLLQPIKTDLHLSDSQLGFLTGIACGLFYATLGLPIARWADRGNRVTIASVAIGFWGLTVMACLAVTNFVQLLLARVAAGIGEGECLRGERDQRLTAPQGDTPGLRAGKIPCLDHDLTLEDVSHLLQAAVGSFDRRQQASCG